MSAMKRPLDGSIGSQVQLQSDAKKVKLNVQKEDIDQGKLRMLKICSKFFYGSFDSKPEIFRFH